MPLVYIVWVYLHSNFRGAWVPKKDRYCAYCDSVVLPRLTNLSTASASIDDASQWLRANRLQLNHAKTEILWCASQRRQHLLPTRTTRVCELAVSPTRSVRDLGVYINADLSMRTHVTKTVSARFAALRQIRSVRRSLPKTRLAIIGPCTCC